MKKMARQDFLKQCARFGVLAGLVTLGGVLVSRKDKSACTEQCERCAEYKNGKCGIGLKQFSNRK